MLVLDKQDFLGVIQNFPEVEQTYQNIKTDITKHKDLSKLGVHCYLCGDSKHISVDCPEFEDFKGNLKMHALDKLKKLQKGSEMSSYKKD